MSLKLVKLFASVLSSCVLLSSGSSCFALGSGAVLYIMGILGLSGIGTALIGESVRDEGSITDDEAATTTRGKCEDEGLVLSKKNENRVSYRVWYDARGILVDGKTCRDRVYSGGENSRKVYVDTCYGTSIPSVDYEDGCELFDASRILEICGFNRYQGGIPDEWMNKMEWVEALRNFRIIVDEESGYLKLCGSGKRSEWFELRCDELVDNKELSDCVLNVLFDSAGVPFSLKKFLDMPLSMQRHIAQIVETIFKILRVHSS